MIEISQYARPERSENLPELYLKVRLVSMGATGEDALRPTLVLRKKTKSTPLFKAAFCNPHAMRLGALAAFPIGNLRSTREPP